MTDAHASSQLTTVRAGFIPLVDCAVLAVAREQGFAAAHGIDLQLIKEVSWANIRDRLNVGYLDVAHMLAGMPIAANLGIGHIKVAMIAPMALSMGGNAITLSHALYDALRAHDANLDDPLTSAKSLRAEIERRRSKDEDPLTFGMVFPFSCHNYQLRYWMAAAGIDPDHDVNLVVIPPPYMVGSMQAGQVDGFCVGEPWNSQAAAQGVGRILMAASTVWPGGPEKVLGMQERWAAENPDVLSALLKALNKAAKWADKPENHAALAALLAGPDYLDVAERLILAALQGDMTFYAEGRVNVACEHALWLYAQMVRWRQTPLSKEAEQTACRTYRPDLVAEALGVALPADGMAESALLDGVRFDPADVPGYISSLTIKV